MFSRRWNSLLLSGGSLLSVLSVLAAPDNDGFASARVLPAFLPVTAVGGNVSASNETGEPRPEKSARTVWWNWTPSSSGWVRIFTQGADIDTVLAAYTGSSLAGLNRQAFNDDVGAAEGEVGPSELVLRVTAGETYHFQVGGYAGWEGTFSLRLQSVAAPPQLTDLSFTPPVVDVSGQPANATFDLHVTHPGGFRQGVLSLFRPDGRQEDQVAFLAGQRISGDAKSGTYRVTATVAQRVLPGPYSLRIRLDGADGRRAIYGERTPFPTQLSSTIPVVNTGVVDAEPPQLASFTVTPAILDVTLASQTVTLTPRLVDSVSGVPDFSSRLEVRDPAGESLSGDSHILSRRNRVQGDGFDGIYSIQLTIPAGAPPGEYPIRFQVVDALGNDVVYGPDADAGEVSMPIGLPVAFTVINTGTVDTQAPVLTGATVSPGTVNVAKFESLNLSLAVQDAQSGVASVELAGAVFGLRPVVGGPVVPVSMSLSANGGTSRDGTWQGSTSLPETLAAGDYLVVGIQLTDALDNVITYGPAALGLTPYPAGINPVVTIVTQPGDGPYLLWLKNHPELKGADARPEADPDGDRLSNLAELALGTHPGIPTFPGSLDPHAANAPIVRRSGNRLYLDYTLVRENLGTGPNAITADPEQSTDLKSWSGAQQFILGGGAYSAFTTIGGDPFQFLRLYVVDPTHFDGP
ncbi:MAG: hypothetical protein JNL10_21800 [Verrucomicrobiales bacterium]|nr:hypothetical protein [Verrucomicrobiales bacterium]